MDELGLEDLVAKSIGYLNGGDRRKTGQGLAQLIDSQNNAIANEERAREELNAALAQEEDVPEESAAGFSNLPF